MELKLMSSRPWPVRPARAADTSATLEASVASNSARTRSTSPPTNWILASAWPTSRRASRTSAVDTSGAEASHTVPPSNSMPRLTPRTSNATTPMSIRAADARRVFFQSPGKSTLVWLRHKRRQRLMGATPAIDAACSGAGRPRRRGWAIREEDRDIKRAQGRKKK